MNEGKWIHGALAAAIDPEVQVRRRRARVAGIADEAQGVADSHERPRSRDLAVEVRVVDRLASLHVPHPHDLAAEVRRADVANDSLRGGEYGRASRREDVDAVVIAPAAISLRAEEALRRTTVASRDGEGERCTA